MTTTLPMRVNGRPPHRPSDQQRRLVTTLYLAAWTQPQIAEQIGVSEVTLRLHYRRELDGAARAGRLAYRAEIKTLPRRAATTVGRRKGGFPACARRADLGD